MRPLMLAAILLFVGSICAFAQENQINYPTLRVISVSAPAAIEISISNLSQSEIRIWRDSNSWGAARWRVFLIQGSRLRSFYQNPNKAFIRNIPSYDVIPPGENIIKSLDLTDGNWLSGDANNEAISFKKGDRIIVSYDVPKQDVWPCSEASNLAGQLQVWYGVTSAMTEVK